MLFLNASITIFALVCKLIRDTAPSNELHHEIGVAEADSLHLQCIQGNTGEKCVTCYSLCNQIHVHTYCKVTITISP